MCYLLKLLVVTFLYDMCISKIVFIDTEKLCKMQISLQVFFKDSVDRFRITYLKNGFFLKLFFENLFDRFQNSYQSKNCIV